MYIDDTIAAIATPPGIGGVGILAVIVLPEIV